MSRIIREWKEKKTSERMKRQWACRTAGRHITGVLLFGTVLCSREGAATANIITTAGLTLDTSHRVVSKCIFFFFFE